jgi:hypothetical protein
MGQSRQFGDIRFTSAFPPITEVQRTSWHIAFVPKPDVASRSTIDRGEVWTEPASVSGHRAHLEKGPGNAGAFLRYIADQ